MTLALVALFLLPVAARATLFAFEKDRPRSWSQADWSSIGSLPKATDHPEARVLVLSGRTGGWKGVIAVHSWIVFKRENATTWTRYDVVGWGNPVRLNGWAPDGRWYGTPPTVITDMRGAAAQALIPKIEQAVKHYRYANAGDYRMWPGPNSNTFVATILRAVPELAVTMPSLWGLLGVKLGWVEGIEFNLLGLVVGLDIREPAIKLPGFGRLALDFWSAETAPSIR
jgi:hypothetical protein